MTKGIIRALACAALVSGLLIAPTPAEAVTRTWSFTEVTGAAFPIQRGGVVTASVNCQSGYAPVAGWLVPSVADDLRRNSETMGLGSGAGYSVKVDDETGGSEVITVTPHVRCVSVNSFTAGTMITTPVQTFQVDDTSQLAEGEATCPSNYQVIGGSVSFGGTGGVALLTTAPSLGPGWEARGWHENDLGTMKVSANCVLASDIPGAKLLGNTEAIGWGSTSSAGCPSGTAVLTAGTYQVVGDGQAITINQRLTVNGSLTGWSSTSLGSGYMQTRVLCVPTASPTVTVSGPSGYINSNTVSWSFAATDPAAGAGYTMSTSCTVNHPGQTVGPYACSSPVTLTDLAEGAHSLTVIATTSDGRTGSSGRSIVVDTIAPLVTFDDPPDTAHPSSPTIGLTVSDASSVGTLDCSLDDASPAPCPVGTFTDYRGARSVALSGVADGSHVLHVKPTDAATNTQTYDLQFTVDTSKPTVSMTRPNVPFQLSRSVRVAWTGQDATSGLAGFAVSQRSATRSSGFGAWSAPSVLGPGTTSKSYGSLALGSTYCFSVTAKDQVGNVSTPSSRCTAIPLDDRSLTRSSGWTLETHSGWFEGTSVSTKQLGRTLSIGATLKRIGLVAQVCPSCGSVGVYVGSTLVKKVGLAADQTSRRLILLPTFSLRSGNVIVKVLSSGKTVRIDALGVSRL